MPILDTKTMDWGEKRPGWNGAIFSSPSMTLSDGFAIVADYPLREGF